MILGIGDHTVKTDPLPSLNARGTCEVRSQLYSLLSHLAKVFDREIEDLDDVHLEAVTVSKLRTLYNKCLVDLAKPLEPEPETQVRGEMNTEEMPIYYAWRAKRDYCKEALMYAALYETLYRLDCYLGITSDAVDSYSPQRMFSVKSEMPKLEFRTFVNMLPDFSSMGALMAKAQTQTLQEHHAEKLASGQNAPQDHAMLVPDHEKIDALRRRPPSEVHMLSVEADKEFWNSGTLNDIKARFCELARAQNQRGI